MWEYPENLPLKVGGVLHKQLAVLGNENLRMQKKTMIDLLEYKGSFWENKTLVNIYEATAMCQALS